MQIDVNGSPMFFDVEGAGLVADGDSMRKRPTVILLHGGPGADHAVYKPHFGQLADVAQVIYLDHRGNGRSGQSDPADWTLAQWGDDVRGLCDALGIDRPIVLGTSFGGFVAQAYATRHPGHASGLVLISTAAKMEFEAVFNAFELLGGAAVREVAENYWLNPTSSSRARYRSECVPFYTVTQEPASWARRVIWKDDVALHFNGPANAHGQMDFRDELKRVKCPVLVMAGDKDPITPMIFSETIVEHLAAGVGRLERFENCGHGLVADAPDRLFASLRRFIEQAGDTE